MNATGEVTDFRLTPREGSRIAVVGGAGAIGSALARALDGCGCRVEVLDTVAALAGAVAQPGQLPDSCGTHPIDLADESSIRDGFDSVAEGGEAIDGLVNCAGFTIGHDPVATLPVGVWDQVQQVNLRGAFLVAQSAIPMLQKGNAPSMVMVSSVLGIETLPGYAHYGAAKAGVMSLTRALARENAPHLRVNAVAPAAVDTPFLSGGTGRPAEERRLNVDAYSKTVPLGRIAQVSDVVGPILFLLGDGSSYITGQTVLVDGGIVPR